MSVNYLDTNEALRQLNLYFDADAMRASLLVGDRAAAWEGDCGRVFRRLWAVLKSTEENYRDGTTQPLVARALALLNDARETPALVVERGLRPETASSLLAILSRLQAHLVPLRRHLRNLDNSTIHASLLDAMDELALPVMQLAAHVNALASVYDLLLVRPVYRVLESWLYATALPGETDEESREESAEV